MGRSSAAELRAACQQLMEIWTRHLDDLTNANRGHEARSIEAIDARLGILAADPRGRGEVVTLWQLQENGIEAIELLLDRYNLETQRHIYPVGALVEALKTARDAHVGLSPLLVPPAIGMDKRFISDYGHRWIRGRSVASVVWLVGCAGQSVDKATSVVAAALREVDYQPSRGGKTVTNNAVKGWLRYLKTGNEKESKKSTLEKNPKMEHLPIDARDTFSDMLGTKDYEWLRNPKTAITKAHVDAVLWLLQITVSAMSPIGLEARVEVAIAKRGRRWREALGLKEPCPNAPAPAK